MKMVETSHSSITISTMMVVRLLGHIYPPCGDKISQSTHLRFLLHVGNVRRDNIQEVERCLFSFSLLAKTNCASTFQYPRLVPFA
jgi:hypothetical protein